MAIEPIVLIFSLYLLGFIFALTFTPKISVTFACITGFLWGALFYTGLVILLLITHIPYNLTSILIIGILLFLIFAGRLIIKKNLILKIHELLFIIGYSVALLFVISYFSVNNFSKASFDSMLLVNMGRSIEAGNFFNWIMGSPKGYGVLIPILHSSSSFWGMDYYAALQPSISFVFAFILVYINGMIIKSITTSLPTRIFIPLVSVALFFSTPFIWFNTSYIHTNFISGVYLLVSLFAFITGIDNGNEEWMPLGTISLIGFGFCRTENSILAVLILLLVFSYKQVDFKKRLMMTLPYSIIFIAWWFVVMQMKDTPFSDVLTKGILYGYIAIFSLFIIGIFVSKNNWIERNVIRKSHLWIIGIFAFAYSVMLIIKPKEMILSITNIISNSFITKNGGYGVTNYFIVVGLLFLILLSLKNRSFNKKPISLLIKVIFTFTLFVLIMGFFRTPYRIGWGDSANRMFVAILPISITYIFAELTRFSFIKYQSSNIETK